MATLGSLTLKLRATRNLLALDLLQSQQDTERWRQSMDSLLDLKARVSIDWDSFSRAESEIRRWVDSLPKTDVRVGAKFLGTDLIENLKDLERLVANPLKIFVDDKRLFELNEHFKLKERDYKQLQSVLDSPLAIKVDRSQLDNLSRDLRSIENTPQVHLRANVDLESLRTFHEQLNRYSQGRTLELATSVSRTTLNALQNDLKSLASGLTTARVSVQIDSQLQALRSELGNLPNVTVGVSIDDSALGEFDRKLGRRQLELRLDTKELGKSIQDAVQGGFKGNSSLLGTITSPFKSILRGAFEGAGRDLFGGVSKSFSEAINTALGNTIGSTDLVGRKLGEKTVNKFQQIGYQLAAEYPVIGANTSIVQKEIRASLGERDVAIEANKARGKQAKQKQQDLAIAREGITEERKAARENLQIAEKNAVKIYQDVKPLQAEIDRQLAPDRQKQIKLSDIRLDSFKLSPIEKLRSGWQETRLQSELDSASKKLRERLTAQGLPTEVVESRVAAETKRREEISGTMSDKILSPKTQQRMLRLQERINQRREKFQPAQDLIDGRLAAAKAQVDIAQDRSAAADAQAKLLRRKQQPKIYQNILDEIAPNLPEHLVPKLVSNPNAKAEGEFGRYNVVENQVYLDPHIYDKLQSGKRLTKTEYKTVREELEHAKDLKFGQFAGYQSLSERRLLGQPVKATPAEEAAVALELKGYAEDVKPFERNAKIKTNRAYDRYANESRLEDINNYVGEGGRKFSRQALNQFKAADTGLSTAAEVAQAKGVKLPSLAKLETGVKDLKLEHLRLVEEIQKAQAGTLSPQEVQKLETDLIAHTNQIVSTRGRIKNVGKAVVAVANRQDAAKAKASFEANRGSWDDLLSLDTIGSKAKDAATNLGGSLIRAGDRALTPHVNNLLTQVPGQPGVIDYGAGVNSISQLSISDYGKMARLGLQGSAGVAQKAGAFLQGAENVALGLLPGGRAVKKVIQNTALPAAAFATATHFLPGGQVAAHALQGGLQGLLSLPGAGMAAAANGLIGSTIGQLPLLGGSAGAATSALISGGIDLATSGAAGLLAPVLGGKLLLNAGQTAFNRIAPQQDNSKLLLAGQTAASTVANVLPAAVEFPVRLSESTQQLVESGRGLLQAAGSKLITQSIEPLHPQLHSASTGQKVRQLPPAPAIVPVQTAEIVVDIEAQKIGSKEAIEYAKKIQQATKIGKDKLKEALKAKDKVRAEQIAQLLKQHLQIATAELDEIRRSLGSEAAIGTDVGNQLGQTKSVVTRAQNDLNRSISKNKLNPDHQESLSNLIPDPDLEVLSRKRKPRKYDVKKDPASAGFEAIASGEQAANRFDQAEQSIKNREDKLLTGYQQQIGGQIYDPLQNLAATKIEEAKNKLGDLREMGAKVISVFAGFAGLAFVGKMLTDWGSAAFQTASKMQSIETTMGAVTSSSIKARSTIQRSTTESNKLGYNALSALENDAGFYASTKTTPLEFVAPDIMFGLKSYNRVMGVDEQGANLSQKAVVQMAGKGKITAEELFGQLAESSPGGVNVLARSMGMSIGQLRKEMESGSLNSNDALPRFGNQLTAESLGGVDAASKSGAASVGRLQNSFQSLQGAIGEKMMAPTIVGLEATTAASNTLKDNIDTLGKMFAAALLSAAAGAIGLSAGVGLANPVLGFLVRNITLALPLLKTFALQAAVAYAAIEVFSSILNSVNDSSPFKSLADDSEAAFAKMSKGATQTAADIATLKEEIYGKDRSVFQLVGDGISGVFGGQTSVTKKAADDTVNADRLLQSNEAALKRNPAELTESNRIRRSEIDLELSVIRSQNANLTSKDRDKIDINNQREQKLIQERSSLEKPINTRQSELQQIIKNANNIIDSPLRNDTEKNLAKSQLAEAEKEQRKLQEQLVSSASILSVGLRKIGEGLQAGINSIDLASIQAKTRTYLAATQDVRNTGALAQANYTNTNNDLTAKQALQQQAVGSLKSTIYSSENRSTIQALGVDPENISQDQIDRLKSTVTDTRGQSLLGYLSKYQTVKTDLAQTNQTVFEKQYNYLKSIVDYNKGLIDQTVSLQNRLVNLSLTARSAIATLQQQVEQSLVEIDSTSSKAMFQAQRNKIQGAYNKFLEKLGISTDDIFEQIFSNYNSIVDSIQQITERRLSRQSSAITANYRQIGNETRKYQTQTEQNQGLQELQRQNVERQLSNPLNQLGSGESQPVNNNSSSDNTNLQLYRSQRSGLIIPVAGAINSRGGGYKEDTGLDIMTPIGSKVVASGAGTLEYAEDGHSRQIGEDVDPTTSGFQKQKSIRIKLDTPVEYQGRTYQYQYFTHLRSIEAALYNKGTHSRSKGLQQPVRIEAGQLLGETGTAGGGPHLHTGFSADREQRNYLNYQQVSDVLFGTKDTSRNAVGKVTPVQNNAPIAQTPPSAAHFQNNDIGTITSSTYTPGGGGMNGAEKDSRGNRLTPNDYAIAIPGQNRVKDQIPYGSIVKLNYNGKTVNAKVTDGGPYVPGRQMDITMAAAKALGFDGVGQVGVSLQSLPTGADPNKKYYFGEATYKPKFGKGGSVSVAEANKAIASVIQGDKYLTLGKGVQTDAGTTESQSSNSQSAGKGMLGQAILNNAQQQGVDESIQNNAKLSNEYVGKITGLSNQDTELAKKKLQQERNLYNQQDEADRTKLDTQILQAQNQINRNLPAFNRRSTELESQASAYNRSNSREPYQAIDRVYQQYGGVPDSATQDPAVTTAQSAIQRLKEESRSRREDLLKQIQSIDAQGAGWANLKKTIQGQVQSLKKNGFTDDAAALEDFIRNNDKAIGTPKARQATIDRLSRQYHTLPSDGIAVANAIAPNTSKVLTDSKNLIQQYLPKSFDDGLKAEARSIIERFKAVKEELRGQLQQIDDTIAALESEIQSKLKAAGYAPQKIDLTDPNRLDLLRKVAPEETAVLEQTTAKRKRIDLTEQNLDRNAAEAAARSVSIGKRREQVNVDRANTDYLATTQDGNLFSQIQIDKQRYTQGKTDLDLQFEQGAISVDLYTAKLKQLGLETNTLRNAIQPLRAATTGFFSDIFAGRGVFDGLGNAMRNLKINILKNFEDMISKHLGQQLFSSLAAGAKDLQDNATGGSQDFTSQVFRGVSGALGFSGTSNNPSNPDNQGNAIRSGFEKYQSHGINIGLNSSILDRTKPEDSPNFIGPRYQPQIPPAQKENLVGGLSNMLIGGGLRLLGIPGLATGGVVSSPTVALVGEGIHNEAIVPLPNGRSIPVDLKGAGESSSGNVNSSVSVTIHNSGSAKETSRGDANSISNLIRGAVMDVLVNERRTGGLLA